MIEVNSFSDMYIGMAMRIDDANNGNLSPKEIMDTASLGLLVPQAVPFIQWMLAENKVKEADLKAARLSAIDFREGVTYPKNYTVYVGVGYSESGTVQIQIGSKVYPLSNLDTVDAVSAIDPIVSVKALISVIENGPMALEQLPDFKYERVISWEVPIANVLKQQLQLACVK